MPDINGTNGPDDIEVTNDSGTLNGTPQGTPIDNVRGRQGDDTINVTDSTISGSVRGDNGSDTINISGSTVIGQVNSGNDADTVTIQGSMVDDVQLGGGDDTLNFISTDVTGRLRGGAGNDALNLPVGTVISDDTFGTITVEEGVSYTLSAGSFTLPSGTTVNYTNFESGAGFPCFSRHTRIQAKQGTTKVQNLKPGDLILTRGNGLQRIRWTGRRRFDAADLQVDHKRYPVRILSGTLGRGLPRRDLLVSRQHRMLVNSRIAMRMFGAPEVLIPAIKLTALPGIFVDEAVESVEYFHLLFDRHEVIFAEDAPTESLFTGPEALRSLSHDARREIFDIFPELRNTGYSPDPARYIPRGRQQAQLVARHLRNNKPLLQA